MKARSSAFQNGIESELGYEQQVSARLPHGKRVFGVSSIIREQSYLEQLLDARVQVALCVGFFEADQDAQAGVNGRSDGGLALGGGGDGCLRHFLNDETWSAPPDSGAEAA
ncbi:hypothetical protein BWQ96_05756 [Gracilariopsis chorda]|uniref:Uncharacterized protein n=1 Tax=Gracilariopsis chorda TaxID=448386 RepID=A0A2V3IQX1_9FLOR|nr:hypothetical protein BWQ96_05756 [Gracilariopsis chorda]|eukprot:PXF44484.1 hypothetical protein BWQ96_05756 [Gracilariopsis chorda]